MEYRVEKRGRRERRGEKRNRINLFLVGQVMKMLEKERGDLGIFLR